MTHEEITKEYESLTRRQKTLNKRLQSLREAVERDGCPHPKTYTYDQSQDDGYGRWWKVPMERCLLCHARRTKYQGNPGEWRKDA